MQESSGYQPKNQHKLEEYLEQAGGDHELANLLSDKSFLFELQSESGGPMHIDEATREFIKENEEHIAKRRIELGLDPPTDA